MPASSFTQSHSPLAADGLEASCYSAANNLLTWRYTCPVPMLNVRFGRLWPSSQLSHSLTHACVQVQGETMGFVKRFGAQHRVCPHVPMSRVECTSDVPNSIIPYGLLVRVWRKGTEPDPSNPIHYRSPVDRKYVSWLKMHTHCRISFSCTFNESCWRKWWHTFCI